MANVFANAFPLSQLTYTESEQDRINAIAAIRNEQASIDAVLSAGVSSVSVDGTTTNYDLDALRTRRNALQQALAKLSAREAMRRPVASSIFLGAF